MEIIPAKLNKWKKFKTEYNIEGYAMLFEVKNIKFYIRSFNDDSYGICLIDEAGLLNLERIFNYREHIGNERINDKDKLITESVLLIIKNLELIREIMKTENFYEITHSFYHDSIYCDLIK